MNQPTREDVRKAYYEAECDETRDTIKKLWPEAFENKYPKLMECKISGILVYFVEESVGTVVYGSPEIPGASYTGQFSNRWYMPNFKDYKK